MHATMVNGSLVLLQLSHRSTVCLIGMKFY